MATTRLLSCLFILGLGAAAAQSLPPTSVLKTIFTQEGVSYLKGFERPSNRALGSLVKAMYNELDSAFWRWAIQFFVSPIDGPFNDPTGEFCLTRQEGDVIFLAGTFFGDGSLTSRSLCEVAAGTWLYIPIVNIAFVSTMESSFEELEEELPDSSFFQDLNIFIDGEDFGPLIRETNSRGYLLPSPADDDGNVSPIGTSFGPVFPFYSTIGNYALVPPLLPGEHRIQITGNATTFSINVEYNPITVVEETPLPNLPPLSPFPPQPPQPPTGP